MKTEGEQRAWEALPGALAPKLLAALRKQTQRPALDFAAPPAPLGGGFWALLYTFRLAQAPPELSGELVLRVMPASDEEARREAAAQAAVVDAGFPAPRVHPSLCSNVKCCIIFDPSPPVSDPHYPLSFRREFQFSALFVPRCLDHA